MSNSTIIACEQTGSTAYGIEKDNERKQRKYGKNWGYNDLQC